MNRFVVLRHDPGDGGPVHWDLLLELCDSVKLASWSFPEPPLLDGIAGEKRFDHRAVYLEYEGEISGNRGIVTRWDNGTFAPDLNCNDIASGRVELVFSGDILQGLRVLEQEDDKWILSKITQKTV